MYTPQESCTRCDGLSILDEHFFLCNDTRLVGNEILSDMSKIARPRMINEYCVSIFENNINRQCQLLRSHILSAF